MTKSEKLLQLCDELELLLCEFENLITDETGKYTDLVYNLSQAWMRLDDYVVKQGDDKFNEKKDKEESLPYRRPVVFDFQPDSDIKLIQEAVDKAISNHLEK